MALHSKTIAQKHHCIGLHPSTVSSRLPSFCNPGNNDDLHSPQNFSGFKCLSFFFATVNFQPICVPQWRHSTIVHAYLVEIKCAHVTWLQGIHYPDNQVTNYRTHPGNQLCSVDGLPRKCSPCALYTVRVS